VTRGVTAYSTRRPRNEKNYCRIRREPKPVGGVSGQKTVQLKIPKEKGGTDRPPLSKAGSRKTQTKTTKKKKNRSALERRGKYDYAMTGGEMKENYGKRSKP